MPEGAPDGAPDGAPEGAPDGAPPGRPDGLPLGIPDGARHAGCCCPEPPSPLFEEADEPPEPQPARTRDESAGRAMAGTRRARFTRINSEEMREF